MDLRRSLVRVLALALLVAGCAPAPPAQGPGAPRATSSLTSGTAAERFFPLRDGYVYHYVTETGEGQGLVVARAVRLDATHGELRLPNVVRSVEYLPDGVMVRSGRELPAYLLKLPLAAGTQWRSARGAVVRIAAVDLPVQVQAGRFTGCVQTIEERGGDQPLRLATTYCPDTGIVLLEATSGAELERMELKSFGPPIDIGPEGVRRLE
ncbi:MAG: hypothetical protein HY744_20960 [Deltaproteobacteria bacterium]|nr:hypothetical protein [Deltaproteobacteria bacterium]